MVIAYILVLCLFIFSVIYSLTSWHSSANIEFTAETLPGGYSEQDVHEPCDPENKPQNTDPENLPSAHSFGRCKEGMECIQGSLVGHVCLKKDGMKCQVSTECFPSSTCVLGICESSSGYMNQYCSPKAKAKEGLVCAPVLLENSVTEYVYKIPAELDSEDASNITKKCNFDSDCALPLGVVGSKLEVYCSQEIIEQNSTDTSGVCRYKTPPGMNLDRNNSLGNPLSQSCVTGYTKRSACPYGEDSSGGCNPDKSGGSAVISDYCLPIGKKEGDIGGLCTYTFENRDKGDIFNPVIKVGFGCNPFPELGDYTGSIFSKLSVGIYGSQGNPIGSVCTGEEGCVPGSKCLNGRCVSTDNVVALYSGGVCTDNGGTVITDEDGEIFCDNKYKFASDFSPRNGYIAITNSSGIFVPTYIQNTSLKISTDTTSSTDTEEKKLYSSNYIVPYYIPPPEDGGSTDDGYVKNYEIDINSSQVIFTKNSTFSSTDFDSMKPWKFYRILAAGYIDFLVSSDIGINFVAREQFSDGGDGSDNSDKFIYSGYTTSNGDFIPTQYDQDSFNNKLTDKLGDNYVSTNETVPLRGKAKYDYTYYYNYNMKINKLGTGNGDNAVSVSTTFFNIKKFKDTFIETFYRGINTSTTNNPAYSNKELLCVTYNEGNLKIMSSPDGPNQTDITDPSNPFLVIPCYYIEKFLPGDTTDLRPYFLTNSKKDENGYDIEIYIFIQEVESENIATEIPTYMPQNGAGTLYIIKDLGKDTPSVYQSKLYSPKLNNLSKSYDIFNTNSIDTHPVGIYPYPDTFFSDTITRVAVIYENFTDGDTGQEKDGKKYFTSTTEPTMSVYELTTDPYQMSGFMDQSNMQFFKVLPDKSDNYSVLWTKTGGSSVNIINPTVFSPDLAETTDLEYQEFENVVGLNSLMEFVKNQMYEDYKSSGLTTTNYMTNQVKYSIGDAAAVAVSPTITEQDGSYEDFRAALLYTLLTIRKTATSAKVSDSILNVVSYDTDNYTLGPEDGKITTNTIVAQKNSKSADDGTVVSTKIPITNLYINDYNRIPLDFSYKINKIHEIVYLPTQTNAYTNSGFYVLATITPPDKLFSYDLFFYENPYDPQTLKQIPINMVNASTTPLKASGTKTIKPYSTSNLFFQMAKRGIPGFFFLDQKKNP